MGQKHRKRWREVEAGSGYIDRDRWDSIIAWIRAAPHFNSEDLRGGIEELGHGENWSRIWMKGDAGVTYDRELTGEAEHVDHTIVNRGFRGVADADDPLRCEELLRWAKASLGLSRDDYTAFAPQFFRTADNLPDQSYTFVGRDAELSAIEDAFSDGSGVCLTSVTLHGLGGQGKTALAYYYARSRRTEYAAIIWIDARRTDIDAQLQAFAREHGVDVPFDLKGDGWKARFYEDLALHFRGRLLIVADDLPANALRERTPSKAEAQMAALVKSVPRHLHSRYRFLLTSRQRVDISGIKDMPVKPLELDDAVALFIDRSTPFGAAMDPEELRKLVGETLGRHALTISLLAAYARQRRIDSAAHLADLLRNTIVDAEAFQGTDLAEYGIGLRKTFELTFVSLPRSAKLVMLLLGMFQRRPILVRTIREGARRMEPESGPVAMLRDHFARGGGASAAVRSLVRLGLAEHVQAPGQKVSSHVLMLQLHEVLYDFARAEWRKLAKNARWSAVLADLERSFTGGAIQYVDERMEQSEIDYLDLDNLSGFLVPRIDSLRGGSALEERIAQCLDFWYEHFVFQNYMYDTGIQDDLLEPLLALREHLIASDRLSDRFGLVLGKLIGHIYYASPKETGETARRFFDDALALAELLDALPAGEEGAISTARWYIVFLLDHRSNVLSKVRDATSATSPIRDDPLFARDFDRIEAALPASLKGLDCMPEAEECELLVRAAHYWGHRGNQDSHIAYRRLVAKQADKWGGSVAMDAVSHYRLAVNYRLMSLQVFQREIFGQEVAPLVRQGRIPSIGGWIDRVPKLVAGRRLESFTSLSQCIGDTAHQYRGMHFSLVIAYLSETDPKRRSQLHREADEALKCASLLWSAAAKAASPGEAPLRYQLWMASSEIAMELLTTLERGLPPAPLETMTEELIRRIKARQESLRASYRHSAEQQQTELEGIWRVLSV